LVVVLALLAGCMFVKPMVQREIWDSYPNSEPLLVHGAAPSTAGQLIYERLRAEPRVGSLLTTHGQPDTIQVLGARMAPKRFVLAYTRPEVGKPYRIVIDPTEDGLIARAPEPFPTAAPAPAPTAAPRPPSERPPPRQAPAPAPATPRPSPTCIVTSEQARHCPIEPKRPDCRALCSCVPRQEWCP
jgi:hypothetical protein